MAKLYFRYGAMNSGKSTALLQAAFNYEERGQQVLLAKPAIDSKGDNAIVSRLGMTRNVDFTVGPEQDIYVAFTRERERVIRETGRDVSCLLVDESQFLNESQVDDLLLVPAGAVDGHVVRLLLLPQDALGERRAVVRHARLGRVGRRGHQELGIRRQGTWG